MNALSPYNALPYQSAVRETAVPQVLQNQVQSFGVLPLLWVGGAAAAGIYAMTRPSGTVGNAVANVAGQTLGTGIKIAVVGLALYVAGKHLIKKVS